MDKKKYGYGILITVALLMSVVFISGCNDKVKEQCGKAANYDLAAVDWCVEIKEDMGMIRFYPIVQNVGIKPVCGDGSYKVGITVGTISEEITGKLVENKYDPECKVAPYYVIEPGKKASLDPVEVFYHDENKYSSFGFVVHLDKDTCSANDGLQTNWIMTGKELKQSGKKC